MGGIFVKRVGLCLSYRHTNYGTLLQAFATQRAIDRLGYTTEIIDYVPGNDPHKRYTPGAFLQRNVTNKLFEAYQKRTVSTEESEIFTENRRMRLQAAESFRSAYLHSLIRCNGFGEARENSKRYAAVLVGSDQVWNPRTSTSNYFTLRFVADGVKRISYATSMGVSKWPWYLRGEAREFLKKMDRISVREQSASQIIRALTDRNVQIVCDPTCLLTKEDWAQQIPCRDFGTEYILLYFLGKIPECARELAARLSEQQGIPQWEIMSTESHESRRTAERILVGTSVEEFLNLIRRASFVLTDSYHGMMLSLIHQKPFYVFYRFRENTQYQRNARIDDALERFGIPDRLVHAGNIVSAESMQYSEVTERLLEFRKHSMDYLQSALP